MIMYLRPCREIESVYLCWLMTDITALPSTVPAQSCDYVRCAHSIPVSLAPQVQSYFSFRFVFSLKMCILFSCHLDRKV